MDANNSAKGTAVARRSRRRWLQYSLRSLFALVTLVACVLGYFAYLYRSECEIANRIRAVDPNARFVWKTPEWLSKFGLKDRVKLFNRIEMIFVCLNDEENHPFFEDDEVEALELDRLLSLKIVAIGFDAVDRYALDYAMFKAWIRRGNTLSTDTIDSQSNTLEPSCQHFGGTLPGFTPEETSSFDTVFQEGGSGEISLNFVQRCVLEKLVARPWNADECDRIPDGSKFSYSFVDFSGNQFEIGVGDILKHTNEMKAADTLLACRALWRGKSRRYAKEIIEYARKLQPKTDDERTFKELVARDTSPERILSGLRGIRHAFSAWLAALEPRPEYLPELIRAVEEGRAANETLYALEHSTDDRAVRFLKSRHK